jgi:hypothetical protein
LCDSHGVPPPLDHTTHRRMISSINYESLQ